MPTDITFLTVNKRLADHFDKHDLSVLRRAAGWTTDGQRRGGQPQWDTVKDWSEQTRYKVGTSEQDAQDLYDAIENGSAAVDQSTLVENQIETAAGSSSGCRRRQPRSGRLLGQDGRGGLWFLYVATDIVDREGPAAAYRAVHASLQKLPGSRVPSSEIKVVSPSNPLARDMLAIMVTLPRAVWPLGSAAKPSGRWRSSRSYIYPSHVLHASRK